MCKLLRKSEIDSVGIRKDQGIPWPVVIKILMEDLGMTHVGGSKICFLVHVTREERNFVFKLHRIITAHSGLDFLKKAIKGDESWVYNYESETKAEVSQ